MKNCLGYCHQGRKPCPSQTMCTKLEQRSGGGNQSSFMPVEMYEEPDSRIMWLLALLSAVLFCTSVLMLLP